MEDCQTLCDILPPLPICTDCRLADTDYRPELSVVKLDPILGPCSAVCAMQEVVNTRNRRDSVLLPNERCFEVCSTTIAKRFIAREEHVC
jgi:hypothetical protein